MEDMDQDPNGVGGLAEPTPRRSDEIESALTDVERAAVETDDDARLRALEKLHGALEDEVEQTAPPGR